MEGTITQHAADSAMHRHKKHKTLGHHHPFHSHHQGIYVRSPSSIHISTNRQTTDIHPSVLSSHAHVTVYAMQSSSFRPQSSLSSDPENQPNKTQTPSHARKKETQTPVAEKNQLCIYRINPKRQHRCCRPVRPFPRPSFHSPNPNKFPCRALFGGETVVGTRAMLN